MAKKDLDRFFGQILGLWGGSRASFWLKYSPSIADWSLNVANVSAQRKKFPLRTETLLGKDRPKLANHKLWLRFVWLWAISLDLEIFSKPCHAFYQHDILWAQIKSFGGLKLILKDAPTNAPPNCRQASLNWGELIRKGQMADGQSQIRA